MEAAADPDTDVSLQLCPSCGGEGYELVSFWVYEHGCGVPHRDVAHGRRCEECNGDGLALIPVEPIDEEDLKQLFDEMAKVVFA
jgi:hypothetical protein